MTAVGTGFAGHGCCSGWSSPEVATAGQSGRAYLEGNRVCGFAVQGGTTAILNDCSAHNSCSNGIQCVDPSTDLSCRGCIMIDSGNCGVSVGLVACSVLKGVKTSGHKVGGFACGDEGSYLQLVDCVSEEPRPVAEMNGGQIEKNSCIL